MPFFTLDVLLSMPLSDHLKDTNFVLARKAIYSEDFTLHLQNNQSISFVLQFAISKRRQVENCVDGKIKDDKEYFCDLRLHTTIFILNSRAFKSAKEKKSIENQFLDLYRFSLFYSKNNNVKR